VGVVAGRDGPQAAVGAVGVGDQQQPLDQDILGQAATRPDARQRAQRAGAKRGFLEHLDQVDGAPTRNARPFQLSQVLRLALQARWPARSRCSRKRGPTDST
jgi:hypothetical protein